MNFKLIGYRSSNNMMCTKGKTENDDKSLNIYLGYTNNTLKDACIVPVKIKLGSSILKGKRVAAFGRKSLICKDICLNIKSDLFFNKSLVNLFSYDLSLNFSLEKYIDIAVGICSNDNGLGMFGEVKTLVGVANDTAVYNEPSSWIYLPTLYLKIQINWLELRK